MIRKHTLTGTVTESSGPVPRALVILKSGDGTVHRCAETDDRGRFAFHRLPRGKVYDVIAVGSVELDRKTLAADASSVHIQVAKTTTGTVQIASPLPAGPDPATLEKYAKLLGTIIATVTAIGGIFKETAFRDLAPSGNWALAAAVFLATVSAAFVLWSLLVSQDARACTGQAEKARTLLGTAGFSFGAALLAIGVAPIVSMARPGHDPAPTYGVSYDLDTNRTLVARFEGRGFTPQTAASLYAAVGDTLLAPQVGELATDSGAISLELTVNNVPCALGDSAGRRPRVVARWIEMGTQQSVLADVACPPKLPEATLYEVR